MTGAPVSAAYADRDEPETQGGEVGETQPNIHAASAADQAKAAAEAFAQALAGTEDAALKGAKVRISLKGIGTGHNPRSREALRPTQWAKGQSGNPLGPRRGSREAREADRVLRSYVVDAAHAMGRLIEAEDETVRRQASGDVLDRVLGKAVQRTEVTRTEGPADELSTDELQARLAELEDILSERAEDITPVADADETSNT